MFRKLEELMLPYPRKRYHYKGTTAKFKGVLYSQIWIFLQKTIFLEHEDSTSLSICKSYFETIFL